MTFLNSERLLFHHLLLWRQGFLHAEMGSGRVQPESDRLLARDFITSDRSRQELPETRPGSGLDRVRTHQGCVGHGQDEELD
jgi:hypothetical protein